jgi:phage terminase small subunit
MRGRPGKPIDLMVQEGKKHFGKDEIEARRQHEEELTTSSGKLVAPPWLKENLVAYREWRRIIKQYHDVNFISVQDINHIARYCEIYSQLLDLIERRKKIAETGFVWSERMEVKFCLGELYGIKQAEDVWEKIMHIISTDGLLRIDKAINSKAATLTAMEDRLYLNPRARVSNVPKQKKPAPEDPLQAAGFGGL